MTADRYDIYRLIHKGLRAYLCETLTAVGRLDSDDLPAVTRTCADVQALLTFCRTHLEKEETYVHPALEAAKRGSSADTTEDHVHHQQDITRLQGRLDAVLAASPASRAGTIHALYLDLSLFVAENLRHMQEEETRNNATLWDGYSDPEIQEIEARIVSSIPPADSLQVLRWIAPSVTPTERNDFLNGVRQTVPAAMFRDIETFVDSLL